MMNSGCSRSRWIGGLAAAVAGAALIAGCTSGGGGTAFPNPPIVAGALQLVAFESCDETMAAVKRAAKEAVGPYGFGGDPVVQLRGDGAESAEAPAAAPDAASAPNAAGADAAAPQTMYSGTNVHEAGVDEPDIVKTDGRRIITIHGSNFYVVDAATKRVSGRLQLAPDPAASELWSGVPTDLLLFGDRALVLTETFYAIADGGVATGDAAGFPAPVPDPDMIGGPRMLLVDIGSAQPRVLGTYAVDGNVVDARQVGSVARVVVRSAPRVVFPYDEKTSDEDRLAENREAIENATADAWLPRYEVTDRSGTRSGRVDCVSVSRPPTYSGAQMLTVVTFDLAGDVLGDGQPVTVMADGGTVYSTGENLYIAHDQRFWAFSAGAESGPTVEPQTEIYQLDISQAGPPQYVASGAVPGWLINQYAMSEWDGHLRVATTVDNDWNRVDGEAAQSESAVYVLRRDRATLRQVGGVGGLGKGEQIYAVRFVGPVGYVVTFRQVDPLYTIDLRNPEQPGLAGELKIPGYSSYLHPAGDGKLIGIGQDATTDGATTGLQVSLFDVANPADPTRVAQHQIAYGSSEAEYDPHAFLYWPLTGHLVVPITTWGPFDLPQPPEPTTLPQPQFPTSGALVLRVESGRFTEQGVISHPVWDPATGAPASGFPQMRRSLVIGEVLWTLSDSGLKANDLHSLSEVGWVPFT